MKHIPIRQINKANHELPSSERFNIRSLEAILGNEDLAQDLHRHDFYFILAIQKGKGQHAIDFTSYKVTDHSIFFLRPGQVHQLELKAGCTGFLVEFNTGFYHPKEHSASQRLRKASNKNYCRPNINRFNKLMSVLTTMFQEYRDREDGYQDIIRANMDIFFVEFVRESPNQKRINTIANSYTQERFEEFSALLEKHIATHKQVSQYCSLMNLSPYQLNEITKSSIGKTASEMINEHIILEAKRYLLATNSQVKEIADLLGYEDYSYFIRFFKKHMGHTPEAFRQHFA
jgi:AraC-like DNA-binding protein